MDIFKNTQDAPYAPGKTPFKAARIRVWQNVCDETLSREPTSNTLCTVCPQPGHLICTGCRGTRYCSAECQRVDRPTHKIFCSAFDRYTSDKRPSPLHIRAILFPEDKKRPEWTWVLMREDRMAVALSHLYANLPTDGLTELTPVTYINYVTARVPQRWLTSLALCQESRGEHASSVNKSVLNLGPPGHLHTYWGPLLVVAGKLEPVTPADGLGMTVRLEDVEMEDVWHVIEGIIYGDLDHPCVVNIPRYPHQSLPGLKVNCHGDRHRFHPTQNCESDEAIYEEVRVPNKYALESPRQIPSIMAFLLGLPWLCRHAKSSFDLWDNLIDEPDHNLVRNNELGDLHACLREHFTDLLGLPAPRTLPTQAANIQQSGTPGTQVLVHVFGEPIRAEHVKVLNLFVEESRVVNGWYIPGIGYKTYNRDVFRRFWEDKKRENDIPGVDLSDVPSPYAWMDKPREEKNYVKNFGEYDKLLEEAVTDVFFDHVFAGGRTSPLAGQSGWAEDFFDPLA